MLDVHIMLLRVYLVLGSVLYHSAMCSDSLVANREELDSNPSSVWTGVTIFETSRRLQKLRATTNVSVASQTHLARFAGDASTLTPS